MSYMYLLRICIWMIVVIVENCVNIRFRVLTIVSMSLSSVFGTGTILCHRRL
jgi:hypothetical protein